MQEMQFKAPWGPWLTGLTLFSTLILVGIPIFSFLNHLTDTRWTTFVLVILPLGIYVGALLFLIRGYILRDHSLLVKRLLWNNHIDLSALRSIEANPAAMSKSIRTFGNGGLFSFSGRFRNKLLGPYRAFATKPKNAVILKFNDRVIVVSPDQPQRFVEEVKTRTGLN